MLKKRTKEWDSPLFCLYNGGCLVKKEKIKKSSQESIAVSVHSLAEHFAKNLGLEIWDVKFLKEGPNYILRIFIDKPSGISLDDCEAMSKAIDRPLDELDPIPMSYSLEVCSPGIERELTCDRHLEKFIGSEVKVRLIRPNEFGKKIFSGILNSFGKNIIEIRNNENQSTDCEIIRLERENISHINLNLSQGE